MKVLERVVSTIIVLTIAGGCIVGMMLAGTLTGCTDSSGVNDRPIATHIHSTPDTVFVFLDVCPPCPDCDCPPRGK